MIELHERLSEFSYGYGVTREIERLLDGVGVHTVPFMPSLLQEKQIGFDVGFGGRGIPLLLQFKLGQSLRRFVRSDMSHSPPALARPFFRFSVDTSEPDGQFETLLKAEVDHAEVYYIAPRFADWLHYVRFFEDGAVLEHSVMVKPGDIRSQLNSNGSPDGHHRIVYDRSSVHVCSEPVEITDVRPDFIRQHIRGRLAGEGHTLGEAVRHVYAGLEDRAVIRRRPASAQADRDETEEELIAAFPMEGTDRRASPQLTRAERARRFAQICERSRSDDDAVAAALGLELWGLGIQLLFAVRSENFASPSSSL